MRARVAAGDNAAVSVKGSQPELKHIGVKVLWRQTLGPTLREARVQDALELDYDYRVSTVAFISTKVLLVGTYHGRVKILRHDGRNILRSDLVLRQDEPIQSVATDGLTAVVACHNIVRLYDLSPRQPSVEVAAYMCEEGYAADVVAAYPHVVNCRDSSMKQSLVHIFASTGDVDVLQTLLSPTNDSVKVAFIRDGNDATALDLAMTNRHPDCVRLLVRDIVQRQDQLNAEDRERVACSLPQLAVLYPSIFRYLLQNLHLCRAATSSSSSGTAAHMDVAVSDARTGNLAHSRRNHWRSGLSFGRPVRRMKSQHLARQLSNATGGFSAGLARGNPARRRAHGGSLLRSDDPLAQTKLAVSCLPLVRGSADANTNPDLWLNTQEYVCLVVCGCVCALADVSQVSSRGFAGLVGTVLLRREFVSDDDDLREIDNILILVMTDVCATCVYLLDGMPCAHTHTC